MLWLGGGGGGGGGELASEVVFIILLFCFALYLCCFCFINCSLFGTICYYVLANSRQWFILLSMYCVQL